MSVETLDYNLVFKMMFALCSKYEEIKGFCSAAGCGLLELL